MAWPTQTELLARAEAIWRPGAADPTPDWLLNSTSEAIAVSKTDVQQALAGRGYSTAQIDAWGGGPGHGLVLQIALFYVATDSRLDLRDADQQTVPPLPGTSGTTPKQGPAVLDRRHELLTMAVTDDAGNLVWPDGDVATRTIGSGRMTRTDSTFCDPATGAWKKW